MTDKEYKSMMKYIKKTGNILRCKNLVEKWHLLSDKQKKDAAALKRAFGWKISVCIEQVYFFGNTVERENRLFGRVVKK